MKRRRRKQPTWLDWLPQDEWIEVRLYRRDHRGTAHFLKTYSLFFFDYATVAREYGGGDYLYVAVRGNRILRKGVMGIEGDPIQSPGENGQRRR
jgi:hypothetical protein